MARLKFDVFGRKMVVERSETQWSAFYVGEGKRRLAQDVVIPPSVSESELERYLADLCHEWATERHPAVRRLR